MEQLEKGELKTKWPSFIQAKPMYMCIWAKFMHIERRVTKVPFVHTSTSVHEI